MKLPMLSLSELALLLLLHGVTIPAPVQAASLPDTCIHPSWVGNEYKSIRELAPSLHFVQGGALGDGPWSLSSWFAGDKEQFLVLVGNGKQNENRVFDAVQVRPKKGYEVFLSECHQQIGHQTVAAVAIKKGSRFPNIFQAWLPDTVAGKLVPIDPKSVKCHSDEDIAE